MPTIQYLNPAIVCLPKTIKFEFEADLEWEKSKDEKIEIDMIFKGYKYTATIMIKNTGKQSNAND